MPRRIIRSWYTGHWWVGCYIWYSEKGPRRAAVPPSRFLVVPNVTAHPSTASVPITVLLYDGPLLCGFNVAIKRLKEITVRYECRVILPRCPLQKSWKTCQFHQWKRSKMCMLYTHCRPMQYKKANISNLFGLGHLSRCGWFVYIMWRWELSGVFAEIFPT